MELELGLKITRTREDVSSSVDFRFSKDPFGPLVLSRETDSVFIVIIHLKGFKKEGIEIEINDEGNRITISGRKPVEEMVMIRWMAWRKEVEFREFRKVFRIPDIVDLDKIRARFDDDDATLTITMPKRVKGFSGFEIEEERLELGDASEAENIEREEFDEQSEKSETDFEREEEIGEIMEDNERESRVLEGEENGFDGGVDEEENEDENSEKIHQVDEQDKILESLEDEEIGEQEFSNSSTENEEGQDSREKARHEEQNSQELVEQQGSEAGSQSDDFESRVFKEIEEEECEEVDKTSKSGAMEEKNTDGDCEQVPGETGDERKEEEKIVNTEMENGDPKEEVDAKIGKRFTPNIAETETQSEEFESDRLEADEAGKKHELVETKQEKEENAKMGTKSEDISLPKLQETEEQHSERLSKQEKIKELVEEKTREAEKNIGNKVPEVDTLERCEEKHKLFQEETNDQREEYKEKIKETGKKTDDADARKVQEIRQPMRDDKRENNQDVVGQKETKAENNSDDYNSKAFEEIEEQKPDKLDRTSKSGAMEKKVTDDVDDDDGLSKVQGIEEPERHNEESNIQEMVGVETDDEGKEETKNGDPKEVNAKMGERFKPNIAETEAKDEESESDKQETDEVDKIHELVEKKEEEQHSKGKQRHHNQEKTRELMEEQTLEAETNIAHDTPKPVQEKCEGKHKIEKPVDDGENIEMGKKIDDADARKVHEIRQQELDEQVGCEKESKTRESLKRKIQDGEKEIAEMETKEKELYRPQTLVEQENIQELADEKTGISKNGKVKEEAEEKTEFGDSNNDIPRKDGDIEQQDSDAMKGQVKKDEIQELVLEEKVSDGGKRINAVAETIAENDKSRKVQDIDELSHEQEICGCGEVKDVETQQLVEEETKDCKEEAKEDKRSEESKTKTDHDVVRKVQGNREQELDEPKRGNKELIEESEIKAERGSLRNVYGSEEQELYKPKIHKERDKTRITEGEEPSGQESNNERSNIQEMVEGKTDDEGIGEEETKKIVKMETENGDPEEKVDAKIGERFTPNIGETETKAEEFESDKLEANEVDKMQELIERKEVEEENDKVRRQSEDISVKSLQETEEQHSEGQNRHTKQELGEEKKPESETNTANDTMKPVQERGEGKHKIQKNFQGDTSNQQNEYEEKIMDTGKKIDDADARKVQEIRQQVLDEPTRCEIRESVKSKDNDEEGEIAETETKEKEPSRPKLLEEQDKIHEQEKISDGGKGVITVAETIVENDKSRKVQEIDEQQSNAEDACRGGETSGCGDVEDVETEKKTIEADKRIKETIREAQEIEKNDSDVYGKGDTIQELEETRTTYQNEQDDEKKTQELLEEETKDFIEEEAKEDKGSNESKTKTDDKVQGIREQGLYEPETDHVSKIKELVEEKTGDREKGEEKEITEAEIEAECGSLRKARGSDEHELNEPTKHKERDKTQMIWAEPSGQEKETENENSTNAQEIKPESYEKRYKTQEVVEAGHNNDCKQEQQDEKVNSKAQRVTDEDSSKKVQEIEKQEYDDGLSKVRVTKTEERHNEGSNIQETVKGKTNDEGFGEQDMKEIDENPKEEVDEKMGERSTPNTAETEAKAEEFESDKLEANEVDKIYEVVEKNKEEDKNAKVRRKSEDTDEQHSEAQKRHNKHEKIQELEEEKKPEAETNIANDTLKPVQERCEGKHKIQKNFQEETNNQREKYEEKIAETKKTLDDADARKVQDVRQQVLDEPARCETRELEKTKQESSRPKIFREREQQEEKVIAKAERETDENSKKNVQEIKNQKDDELKRSMVQDKMQETEEKDNTRAMEEAEIVEKRTKSKDGSLRKDRNDEDPETSKAYKKREEDKIQELVETGTSDNREKVKKQSREVGRPDLDEFGRHSEQSKVPQPVEDEKMEYTVEPEWIMEDESSGKVHEFDEQESYEDWTHKERQKLKDLVKDEAADAKDKHTGGQGHNDHREEEQEGKVIAKAELETDEDSSVKVQEIDQFKKSMVQDKKQETGEKSKTRAMTENEIRERGKETKDEDPELGRYKKHGEEDMSQELVETEISDHRGKVKKKGWDDILRSRETSRPDLDEEIENVSKEEATDPKDKHRGGGGHEEERYEKSIQTITKVEDESYKMVRESKELESDKQEQCRPLRERASDCEKEKESLVDDFTGKIQDTGKEEGNESERSEQVGILQKVLERETEDQEDNESEEVAAVSKKVQRIGELELEEPEKHKEQNKIPEISDQEEKVLEKEEVPNSSKVREMNKQRIERKIEKDGDGEEMRGEKGKQGKSVETMSPVRLKPESKDRIERKIQETKEQESNEKNNQEKEYKSEELEGGKTSNQEAKLLNEDDRLRKGKESLEKESNVSKRRAVEQETLQELKQVKKQEVQGKAEVELKANDDGSRKREIKEQESTRLKGQKKKKNHQELMDNETSDQRKEEKEEEVVGKAEPKAEYDSSREIHGNEERTSDKLERYKKKEMSEKLPEEETNDDKEGNRAEDACGEGETKIRDDSFGKVREIEEQELAIAVRHREQDRKQSFVEKETISKAKESKNQETESRDDSSRMTQQNEKHDSHEPKRNEEQDTKKNLGLVEEKTTYLRNEEDGKEIAEAEIPRKLKRIDTREPTEMVERRENQDNIEELVEETLNNQEGGEKKSMIREIVEKAEDQESKELEGLSKQDKIREPVKQRLTDNPNDEETKSKENESRKFHQIKEKEISEQERLKEQGRIKELVEDRTRYSRETEFEDGSSEKTQEVDKEESIEPGRDKKRDKIQEPVDRVTSEDDEELEVEVEDEEEDWEAEVIQETDSDEDNEKNRQIRKLKLGFQLVGGSALFMSLIVIVIKFIHSKRKIRCYKF